MQNSNFGGFEQKRLKKVCACIISNLRYCTLNGRKFVGMFTTYIKEIPIFLNIQHKKPPNAIFSRYQHQWSQNLFISYSIGTGPNCMALLKTSKLVAWLSGKLIGHWWDSSMGIFLSQFEGGDVGPILGRAHGKVLSLWDKIFV